MKSSRSFAGTADSGKDITTHPSLVNVVSEACMGAKLALREGKTIAALHLPPSKKALRESSSRDHCFAMRQLWIKAAAALAAIWLVAGSVIMWARSVKTSPQSVAQYMDANPLDGRPPEVRKKVIDDVTEQLSRLDFDERKATRMEKRPEQFFKNLTPDEQAYFVDRTVPAGFKQMMEAINRMTPEKRMKFVYKAVEDLRREREEGGEAPPNLNDPNVQKIMAAGLKSFYSEASPEVKLQLAPLLEEMQQNLTGR